MSSRVAGPPRARGSRWSNWTRRREPQMPPPGRTHWQQPPSRLQTARFTAAVVSMIATLANGSTITRHGGWSPMGRLPRFVRTKRSAHWKGAALSAAARGR
jgi:hypothetical protein